MSLETKYEIGPSLISRRAFSLLVFSFVTLFFLYSVRGTLAPVLLSFILAYAFNPLVGLLRKYHLSRTLASTVCLLILLAIFFGLVAMFAPAIQHEIQSLARRLPAYVQTFKQSAIPWIEENLGLDVPNEMNRLLGETTAELGGRMQQFAGPITNILKETLSGTLSVLSSLIYVIIIPLFVFYFLRDYNRIINWFKSLVPEKNKDKVFQVCREIDDVMAGFLRGQMIIMSTLVVLYGIILSLLGVPAAISIAILAGFLNIVPYLGTATGIILSVFVLLLEGSSLTSMVGVSFVFITVATLDGLFLTPKVLGDKIGLAPVVVILAILAFGEMFGFVGVLIAIPVSAMLRILGKHLLEAYRKSKLYSSV
jgi:predicted PurR-regulated permease PerM